MGLIEPMKYGENFHELYTNSSDNRKIQTDRPSKNKRKKCSDKKLQVAADTPQAGGVDQIFPLISLAQIELEPNASKFSVYSSIRSAVLEADTKYALFVEKPVNKKHAPGAQNHQVHQCCLICAATCKNNALVECACHAGDKKSRCGPEDGNSEAETESEEISQQETIPKVPLIVGAGLRSLFELIADARNVQPGLCTKALKALFDVIQGQQPESFKYEPEDLINSLYDLLLDLATLHGPNPGDKHAAATVNTNWSSIACSALIGLCVARGDTGKILKAIAALLMSPKLLSTQIIQLPIVLSSLQRTVISAALNKPINPDYHTHGVPANSLIDDFFVKAALSAYSNYTTQPALASDGKFLYLLVSNCLLKIGTGFNGSYKGHVYAINNDFGKDKSGWLGYSSGKLYFKRLSKRSNEPIQLVNTDTLVTTGTASIILVTREGQNNMLFSDESSLNAICTTKDDTLVVKQLNTEGQTGFELPLKLARKKFRTLGYAAFEDEVLNQNQIQKIQSSYNMFEPKLPNDVEIQGIACGKEFGIIRASNGKVYYYGKSASLGLKSVGRTPTMKMTELIISKVSNIVQVAVGHDGVHSLLVNDDGTVYFAGTARRGEDGDTSKNRRQPKAVKPKKLSKIDGHVIVQAACNNGTSAFVTKTGKLIMYGKDTAHCDAMGFVTELMDQHITKVALGKAHCVALNSKGQLFTFGLNNKGQCGRSFTKEKDNSASDNESKQSAGRGVGEGNFDFSNMCDFDDHVLVQGQCRVCSVCKECTGYNVSCVSALSVAMAERVAGALCPCGHGDAGCSKCGACSACISLQEGESNDLKDSKPLGGLLNRKRSKSLILRQKAIKIQGEENNPPSDVERDTPRVAPLSPQKVNLPTASPIVQIACGLHHTVVLTLAGEVFTFGSNQYGQLGTGDLQPAVGPVCIRVQGLVSQIATGSNHTVLLTHKGMVYTFGNYQKGQLGRLPTDSYKMPLSSMDAAKDEAASEIGNSSNITVQRQKYLWHCGPGAVFGLGPNFGKKATWIGAGGDQTFIKIDESLVTAQMLSKVCVVADKKTILLIPTIPLSFHTLAINRRDGSCVAHYRNQMNFVKIIQANANKMPELNQNFHHQDPMTRSVHEARNQIFELQENHNILIEQRKIKASQEKLMPQIAFSLDPYFNVLWVFDGGSRKISCYNVIASDINSGSNKSIVSDYLTILSPELALSQKTDTDISRSQASLNLLGCLDILTTAQDAIPGCYERTATQQTVLAKDSHSNEYQTVNRFDNFGGGWGYSGHSVEAVRFMTDTDVMICGFGMFGGRGEYSCKLKLYDLGVDGGGYEKDGILISETKEIPYECPARSKYHIMLPKPITASAGRWYLVWARIAGPSSDCGSSGQGTVTTEDQIVFNFKSSKKANNGTDVNSGQIPSIIYRLITQETKQPVMNIDIDPVHKISKSFANTVTKECFESLVLLLSWSWETFKLNLREHKNDGAKQIQTKSALDHLVYVNKSCLRLLRKYTNEIYPQKINKTGSGIKKIDVNTLTYTVNKGLPSAPKLFIGPNDVQTPTTRRANLENIQLAECIGNVRALLIQILCDDVFRDVETEDGWVMLIEILDECHTSFVVCFDAFYPTSSLKWNSLCDLLSQMDKGVLHSRLLSAILAGLCNPSIKLRTTFSLLTPGNERQSIISPSDNSGLPMLSSTENHQYPILVEQMIYRTQQEKIDFLSNSWTFKDVLVRLLDIISNPIKVKIENIYNRSNNSNDTKFGKDINQGLINNCCHLLARVLAEIVYQTSSADYDATLMPPRSLHSTGTRFARCDATRTWNTGNFGPDAIAFSVDRPGIAVAGAMVYSGSGSYEYQLELLYDNTVDPQSQHKWETLESTSGSYDQDAVQNEMTEIKFERPVHIKENARYALRLCSQGSRTCSGDAGLNSIRGPCGTTFSFFPCDLSFNGTTPTRGQLPCFLYYSTPVKHEGHAAAYLSEITARETALQIATDITKKCTELLIMARNALAASISPSDKSPNSSNHTQTVDSEHNITPIEEHLDITWANNSRNSVTQDANMSTARDITKRIGSFSKGIMETLKFDKRSTNPFDYEIEIGATEIHPKDLIDESDHLSDRNFKNGRMAKLNGNDRTDNHDVHSYMAKSDSEESTHLTIVQLLELFNINSSNMFHTLLPLVYAHIGALACSDPKSSVQILSLIKEILPHVAALNQLYATKEYSYPAAKEENIIENKENIEVNKKKMEESERNAIEMCTTSNHYCIVESEHPYKSASINTFRVEFPPCVQWLTVEFDPQCGTAQMEDYLLLSIPAKPTVPPPNLVNEEYSDIIDNNMTSSRGSCKNASLVTSSYNKCTESRNDNLNDSKRMDNEWVIIKKYNAPSHWSQNALVLPGNKVEFSLETASLYAHDQQANKYGFKCLVIGYDNPIAINLINSCLIRLEYELSYLGGMCSANLMKKDLCLPDDRNIEDLSSVEETLAAHSSLLSKGLALSDSVLTVNQALDPFLPVGSQSNERQFLKDFISGAPGSSGARLAAWLQPEPRLDPNKCELNPVSEPIRYGWPTQLIVTIRDQYGDTVVVPDLKVDIKAIPAGAVLNGGRKVSIRNSYADANCLGGIAPPPRISYEPTFKERMCFKAITFMKVYNSYSFEELRFCSPIQTRVTETLNALDLEDGSFTAQWTPNSVGSYCLTVLIDGVALEEIYRVEVKEGGIPPPPQRTSIKKPQPPNKLRKFMAKNSAGLRIRSHPTLQSEQVGIVKMNGVISFIDEIENDDGIWVRLSTESIRQHCTAGWYPTEAWCLQYNQHLGKTLLHPVIEPSTKTVQVKIKQTANLTENADVSQHIPDVEAKSKTASPNKKGFEFSTTRFTPPISSDALTSSTTNPFVFQSSSSGGSSKNFSDKSTETGNLTKIERRNSGTIDQLFDNNFPLESSDEGYLFAGGHQRRESHDSIMSHSQSTNIVGSAIAGVVGGGASKLQALQKWFKGDCVEGAGKESIASGSGGRKKNDISDLAAVSVRDFVKAIGGQETKSNGNGATPPQVSRSSSPVFIPSNKQTEAIAVTASAHSSSSKSAEVSDTSVLVSSLTRDLSQSPSQASIREDPSGSPKKSLDNQSSTQSDFNSTAVRVGGFSIGASSSIGGSPKRSSRKIPITKRPMSPAERSLKEKGSDLTSLEIKSDQTSSTTGSVFFDQKSSSASTENLSPPVWPSAPSHCLHPKSTGIVSDEKVHKVGPPKRAMPPSLAESLRAVFAAFLWHEGIVHDAMACASFLKFHPSLPKEGALVVSRSDGGESKINLSREQKAQQRHSVEVANAGNYLNIRPSTLETLTKSGNSSINRRYRKNAFDQSDPFENKPKLQSLPEVLTVLPPALRCLVYLWEQLCSNCIQIVQSSTLEQKLHFRSSKDKFDSLDKDSKKLRKKKKDDGSWCELCEIFLPIPVTYHMRIVHPGCGKSAKGKGYNSVGLFCEGWAGNCGEGGKGASSWFLMCDSCREKYVTTNKNVNNINNSTTSPTVDINLFGIKANSMIANSEIYTMMKENAIFLLELSSSTSNLLANQKRSPQQMPVVTEDQLNLFTDMNRPSTSRCDSAPNSNRNSRIGLKMNGAVGAGCASGSSGAGKFGGPFSSTPHRKSSCFPSIISPELMWQAPETFSCLESLGASINDDLPYEIFGINSAENCFERPLSEISFDSCDPNNSELIVSSTSHATNTLSRFHRSFSMGQGWTAGQGSSKIYNQPTDDQQHPKVVLRRRNNSTSEEGSLLLCYPSENLRKLVPEKTLNSSCVIQNAQHIPPVNDEKATREKSSSGISSETAQPQTAPAENFQKDFSFPNYGPVKAVVNNSNNLEQSVEEKNLLQNVEVELLNTNCLLARPTMSFIIQHHDLEKLRYAMKRSLRIATCRIYSLQALNWLVRSVTQTVCLHDLMWWFVSSLSSSSNVDDQLKSDDSEFSLEHPVSITQMSGRVSQVLSQSLHIFLQSVADLTLLIPAGSSLQRIAIQCFGIRFRQADHQFLHSSHVFGNISKILSRSDEQNEAMLLASSSAAAATAMIESDSHMIDHNYGGGGGGGVLGSQAYNTGTKLYNYFDLNGAFEITVSSRQAMAASLTDNSTETFWESDEEDRNKCKIIEISMNKITYVVKSIFVHIDNSRDIQNKVLNVVFFAGQSLGDTNLIRSVDIDPKACTWISANIPDETYTHFRLEFRGPENTLRVRQIKLLGLSNVLDDLIVYGRPNLKQTNALQIQQRSCEAETLRVFRLITGQVFGKLISTADHILNENMNLAPHQSSIMESSANSLLADSLDLREHMVGILFSRSKLSHLQKQVIVHIVQAIRKEAQRAKEEWEISNANASLANVQTSTDLKSESSSDRFRAPDTYCFEMLSMVLALSGSTVGRSYLSHQHGLLKDLLSLLHTGSDRVQRQVTSLLRRILPEISPDSLGDLLGVQKMPPTDFNIVNQNAIDFDMNRLGVLDIFLAVIAKSLQLQIKIKTTTKAHLDKTPAMVKLCNCIDFSVHSLKVGPINGVDKKEFQIEKPAANQFDFETETVARAHFNDFEIIRKKPKEVAATKNLNQRWFLKGAISVKQAESIINLIRDMASGKLTEKWSLVTKAAIAESVLNLTRLDEVFRTPENCIKTSTLWLALASLCVLDKDHVEKLSSGQWSKTSDTRPLCSNHDDGETPAVIQCEVCGSLCGDCDRFLHLNRKTRNHRRTVCKEEEEAIRVELHESCGRTKLFWLLALADSRTLKGMVEFRDGSNTIISGPQEAVGRCRFCGVTGNSGLLAIGNVCADTQCQEHAANACTKTKSCGHTCGGVANEQKCLPCLQHVCHERENEHAEALKEPKLTQDADDMCMICFVEALSCAPSIQLECGHVFHFHCAKLVLEKRWTGPRITFGFSLCPICKGDIQHPLLADILEPITGLKMDVKRKGLMRLKYEGVVKASDNKDLTNYAMDRYAYYVCFKCQKAYYGGEVRCDAEAGDNFDPQELVCGGCSDVARAQMCPKHGTDFLEYKCRYCCSVAVFFCFGTTHFCDTCHDDFQRLTNIPKIKLPQCPAGPKAKQLLGDDCPLHIVHPPTGEEFALGCGICRNAQTF